MKLSQLVRLLVATIFLAVTSYASQTLFFEDFNNAQTAASRFTTYGGGLFSGQNLQLAPDTVVYVNPSIGDTGAGSVRYSVIQSLSSGSLPPNNHTSLFYMRGQGYDPGRSYRLITALYNTGAYIALNRVDVNGSTTLVGGSSFAPPVLSSLGPYELSATFTDSADAVDVVVAVNGVTAFNVHDTSPFRYTSGDSAGFSYLGTLGATFDNLQVVSSVPEPSIEALLVLGAALGGLVRLGMARKL